MKLTEVTHYLVRKPRRQLIHGRIEKELYLKLHAYLAVKKATWSVLMETALKQFVDQLPLEEKKLYAQFERNRKAHPRTRISVSGKRLRQTQAHRKLR